MILKSSAITQIAIASLIAGAATAAGAAEKTVAHRAKASAASEAVTLDGAKSRLPTADAAALLKNKKKAADAGAVYAPGVVPGSADGSPATAAAAGVSPQAYGSFDAPYTTVRVAVEKWSNKGVDAATTPVTSYPFRAAGKLSMRFGSTTYVCTASLIKPGVLITAAHCVHDFGEGESGFADAVTWYPANYSSTLGEPYGSYVGVEWRVPQPYVNGTDTCETTGIVCNNDIATVVLKARSNGKRAGDVLGFYGYAWNSYSFTQSPFLGNETVGQFTQLGYPVALDSGYQMERTDAVSWFYDSGNLKNFQMGSGQTGGSSGGPWIVNFGTKPKLQGTTFGTDPNLAVMAVTSWGYTSSAPKVQGASRFGQNVEFPDRKSVV